MAIFKEGAHDQGPAWVTHDNSIVSADISGGVDLTDLPETSAEIVVLDDLVLSADAAAVFSILEGVTVRAEISVAANTPFHFRPRNQLRATVVNEKLTIKTAAAGNVRAWSSWHSEPV